MNKYASAIVISTEGKIGERKGEKIMEVKLFQSTEALFNHYVATHPQGDLLQTTYWGKLKQISNWQYYPLAVVEQGEIKASTLLLIKKLPYLPYTIAYSPRGPLFSSVEALQLLIQEVKEEAKKKKALVWKMDPPIPAGDQNWLKLAQEENLKLIDAGLDFQNVQPRFVMTLPLTAPLSKLLENMKSKTRYNIRYAERRKVVVKRAKNLDDLLTFYQLLEITAKRDKFTVRPLAYFEAIWQELVEKKVAQLFLAYHHTTPLAGAICFQLGKKAWYVYGASSNEMRNLQATHLLQWEMIRWAKSLGCHVYDFRGVSGDLNPENPLYGLYRFKEGFGAQLEEYVGEYDLPLRQGGYLPWRAGLALHQRVRNRKKQDT